jgi:hypothetical protein
MARSNLGGLKKGPMKQFKIVCFSACALCFATSSQGPSAEPVRAAKVIHQSALAPFSLANFGYSDEVSADRWG